MYLIIVRFTFDLILQSFNVWICRGTSIGWKLSLTRGSRKDCIVQVKIHKLNNYYTTYSNLIDGCIQNIPIYIPFKFLTPPKSVSQLNTTQHKDNTTLFYSITTLKKLSKFLLGRRKSLECILRQHQNFVWSGFVSEGRKRVGMYVRCTSKLALIQIWIRCQMFIKTLSDQG